MKKISQISGKRSYPTQKTGEELKVIGDYYRMRAEKYEVLGTLPQSRRTFIISGYAAKEAWYRRSGKESGKHMTV